MINNKTNQMYEELLKEILLKHHTYITFLLMHVGILTQSSNFKLNVIASLLLF